MAALSYSGREPLCAM